MDLMDFNSFWLESGSDPDFCGSRELNRSLRRLGEGQGGPNKGQLDPKIDQNLQSKKLYKSRTLEYRALDSYMDWPRARPWAPPQGGAYDEP